MTPGLPRNGSFPEPPETLTNGDIVLTFSGIEKGNPPRGLVPYYHFRILLADGTDAGHINFRVGETLHVRFCAGHIGFGIAEDHRGNGYALQACRALAPFVRSVYETVIITCDPDNGASIRTLEELGAEYIDTADVPADDPGHAHGARDKRRYHWNP